MRWLSLVIGAATLISGMALRAQTPDTSAVPAAQPTLQQLFDQASAAEEADKCDVALPLFEQLAVNPAVKPGSIPAGAIAVRRGNCLIRTGQYDEGQRYELEGLAILKAAGSQFDSDIVTGELALGRVARRSWQHDDAVRHFRAALEKLTGTARVTVLADLAMVTAFDGGEQPLAYADEAIRILEAQEKPDKQMLGSLRTLRGRILMNQGRNWDAYEELKEAVKLSGGLSRKVNLAQVSIRGDLAQAAILNGRDDEARKYLAYTGMGFVKELNRLGPSNLAPPQCGVQSGLQPEDVAIVEFSIADNGDVAGVQTIYSRGNYDVAASFARAVSEWYFDPEKLAEVPKFYRALSRVELRCSNTENSMPGITSPLAGRFNQWAVSQLPLLGVTVEKYGSELERLQSLAASSEQGGNIPATVAALGLYSYLNPVPSEGTVKDLAKALDLARQAQLGGEIINSLEVWRTVVVEKLERMEHLRRSYRHIPFRDAFLELAANPGLSQDALAQDTALLLAIPASPEKDERDRASEFLLRVAQDQRLAERHPLRQLAWLKLANLSAQDEDFGKAAEYFRQTGLSEEQCALIGPKPALRSSGASSHDYPQEAARMGFEGWVRLEYDITADGKTANARPIVAFPPFVFVKAATGVASGIRYEASYRPSGGAACSAHGYTISFGLN